MPAATAGHGAVLPGGTVLCCLVAGQVRRGEAELFAAPQKQEEPFDSPATEQ